jgi:hypothetical protein
MTVGLTYVLQSLAILLFACTAVVATIAAYQSNWFLLAVNLLLVGFNVVLFYWQRFMREQLRRLHAQGRR